MTDCHLELTQVILADYIYPAIQKQYIAILTHEVDVIETGDVAAVHQMRVSLRRLRSYIQALTPMIEVPKVMGNKPIAKIAKILGKVRDLDVLKASCQAYQSDLPESEKLHLEEVISKIGKRRRKAMVKVHFMLEEQDYQYFKLGINNWLNNPQYTPTVGMPIAEVLPDLLLSSISRLFLHPGWWVDTNLAPELLSELATTQLVPQHSKALHELRKQIKATRYLMELFADRYSSRYQEHLNDFQQVHKLLGNIQDEVVIDSFIQSILGKRAMSKLPTLYSNIDRDRTQNWQAWQPIQSRYQQLSIKQELQLLLIQGMIKD